MATPLSSSAEALQKLKIPAAIKPGEVCQNDAFDQQFDPVFDVAGVSAAAGAGGMRVRRDCEDRDDQHERRVQPDVAFESEQSNDARVDDGDG
jgi:hypothetical protein